MKLGHIAKRGEHKYLIRWRRDGKQLSRMITGDCALAHIELGKELRNEPAPATPPPPRTFQSYAEKEWEEYTDLHWKASTRITQGSFVHRHILPYFGDMLLPEIKASTIRAFHAAMMKKGLGVKTCCTLHSILATMFSLAVEDGLITATPVTRRSGPKRPKAKKQALTKEQLFDLFDKVPIRYKAFFMVLGLTGIRSSEALGLKWADIDFADHWLHVERAISRGKETTPKTEASVRSRPILPELATALQTHKLNSHYTAPSDYVFASASGRPLNPDQLREALQTALGKMGVTFDQPHCNGLHLLRHSSGTLVYEATGGDVRKTQQWLGHSSSRVTLDVYTHLAKDQEQKTAVTLEQAVFAQPEKPGAVH